MKKNKTIIVIISSAILIAGALIFLGLKLENNNGGGSFSDQLEEYQKEQELKQIEEKAQQDRLVLEKAKNVLPPDENDHVLGDPNAIISMIEYSDFECPFCKRFHNNPKEILKNNSNVNWIYRHFPLAFHDPLATDEALASECVASINGNDAFWEYNDLIFETTNSNGKGLERSRLTDLAVTVGVSEGPFQKCLDSKQFIDNIKEDIKSGTDAGVTGTPGTIIRNNKTGDVRFVPGAYPVEYLQQQIDDLLK